MSKPISTDKVTTPIPKPGRGGLKGYISDVARELRKVQWPTPKETTRLTGVVIAVCAISLATISIMAFLSATLIEMIVKS